MKRRLPIPTLAMSYQGGGGGSKVSNAFSSYSTLI